ncbi:TetR/AcrR family transcriptional regulator [Mycobacterium sp. GA-2829]|uniref:TetR/AcrR family transcriptional regulator n=1 Tax=Mycobacterium sp. GA-2829 TaxID=1772283 RepID=UPI0009EA0CD6|nr:TetR/AcrR family transcriptional regulator [Mycobacterium sp. GA-2829]
MRKLVAAAIEELSESSYGELTVRSVAARAAVSPTTAYTYFPSKDALIAEVYLRLVREAAVFTDVNESAEARVKAQLRELALLIADRPHLADACTIALMADNVAVNEVRVHIASEVSRRIAASLGPGYPPAVTTTLHLLFSGAMMHARSSAGGYLQVAEQLNDAVSMVLCRRPSVITTGDPQ